MTVYFIIKKAIEKGRLSKDELFERVNTFYSNGDLNTEQYEELRKLIV